MNRDFDLAQSLRTVESLKVRLLSSVAKVFETTKTAATMEEAGDALSEVIMSAYLLADFTGVSAAELDDKILKQLRINILKDDMAKRQSSALTEHIKKRGS